MIFNQCEIEIDAAMRAFANDRAARRDDERFFEENPFRRHRIRPPFPGEAREVATWGKRPGTRDLVAVRRELVGTTKLPTRARIGVPLDDEGVARVIFEHGLRAALGRGNDPRFA